MTEAEPKRQYLSQSSPSDEPWLANWRIVATSHCTPKKSSNWPTFRSFAESSSSQSTSALAIVGITILGSVDVELCVEDMACVKTLARDACAIRSTLRESPFRFAGYYQRPHGMARNHRVKRRSQRFQEPGKPRSGGMRDPAEVFFSKDLKASGRKWMRVFLQRWQIVGLFVLG